MKKYLIIIAALAACLFAIVSCLFHAHLRRRASSGTLILCINMRDVLSLSSLGFV